MYYPYKSIDPLENKIKYEYSQFIGEELITQWQDYRKKFTQQSTVKIIENITYKVEDFQYKKDKKIKTKKLIRFLKNNYKSNFEINSETWYWLNWIIKRFELKKRIYTHYDYSSKKVIPEGEFKNLKLYIDFSELLVEVLNNHEHLQSLNALLKCLDIILIYFNKFNQNEKKQINNLIINEKKFIYKLKDNYYKILKNKENKVHKNAIEVSKEKNLPKVLLIASDTLRSNTYIQYLIKYKFKLGNTLLISSDHKKLGQKNNIYPPTSKEINNLFNPDLRIYIKDLICKVSSNFKEINTGTINSNLVQEYIKKTNPNLIIYSGFGGEIISQNILNLDIPILHLHSGLLPEFRGSTTIYYSLLKKGICGVSGILLSSDIDTGNIIKIKSYEPPNCKCNLDYEYDSIIRSDLLIEILEEYYFNNYNLISEKQQEKGETYFVIHPLLKHIAMIPLQ